jgi:hypothetical protein
LRVVVENGPHEDLIDLAKLSTGINGWTWRLSEGTVAWGEVHDFLLFGIGLGWGADISAGRAGIATGIR